MVGTYTETESGIKTCRTPINDPSIRTYAGPDGTSAKRVSQTTGTMLAATISSAASDPCSKLPRLARLVDRGRQRLHVQRPQQQRRR